MSWWRSLFGQRIHAEPSLLYRWLGVPSLPWTTGPSTPVAYRSLEPEQLVSLLLKLLHHEFGYDGHSYAHGEHTFWGMDQHLAYNVIGRAGVYKVPPGPRYGIGDHIVKCDFADAHMAGFQLKRDFAELLLLAKLCGVVDAQWLLRWRRIWMKA